MITGQRDDAAGKRPLHRLPQANGHFIVFEGGEGSGKTSALAALAEALATSGRETLVTREPGGTPEGLSLRALLLSADAPEWEPAAELLLMNAARVQHVRRVIVPALQAGRIVLCDRYVGSTLAYQGAGRGLPAADILALHRRFVGDLWPDLTVLLDVDAATGLRRSARRLDDLRVNEGRFEALELTFHERVRADFLARAVERRTLVIDAGVTQDTVLAAVIKGVRAWLAI